jgi:ribonuclease G
LNSQIKYNDLDKIVVKTKKDIIKELKKLISNPKIEFVEDSSFHKEGYKIELYDKIKS